MMGTNIDCPIVDTDPVRRARGDRIGERHDGVVAHSAAEDIAEQHDRATDPSEGDAEATALAGIVFRDVSFRIGLAAILRPGKSERGADIGFALRPCGGAVALVEPSREQRAIGIERDGLETLALGIGGNWARLGEGQAASSERE